MRCKICGEVKPEKEFNRRRCTVKGPANGMLIREPKCKDCAHDQHRARYMKNPHLYRSVAKRYRKENSDKVRAMNYLNRSIRAGETKRPEHCPVCGEKPSRGPVNGSFRGDWRNREIQWACRGCRVTLRSEGVEIPVHSICLTPLPISALLGSAEMTQVEH